MWCGRGPAYRSALHVAAFSISAPAPASRLLHAAAPSRPVTLPLVAWLCSVGGTNRCNDIFSVHRWRKFEREEMSYRSGMGRINKCRELTRPEAWRCCRSAVSASPLVIVDAPSTANLVSSAFYLVEVGFGRKKRWNVAFAHCGGAPKF